MLGCVCVLQMPGHWAMAGTRIAAGRAGDNRELQKERINGKQVETVTPKLSDCRVFWEYCSGTDSGLEQHR